MVKSTLFIRLIFFGSSLLQFASCGLKYPQMESPEQFRERRLAAIEAYCYKEFSRHGSSYTSIEFGETKVSKPIHYQGLDSLYAIKYSLEQQHKTDPGLDEQIRIQRLRIQTDSVKAKYLEKHLFSVRERDSLTYYYGTFQLNKQLEIEDFRIEQSVHLPARDENRYSLFLAEAPLFADNYMLSPAEESFYRFFKTRADQLSGSELDRFMAHIMKTIEMAQFIQSIDPKKVAEQLIRQSIHGKSYKQRNEQFNWTTAFPTEWKNEAITYTVDYYYNQPNQLETAIEQGAFRLTIDPYLQIKRKTPLK